MRLHAALAVPDKYGRGQHRHEQTAAEREANGEAGACVLCSGIRIARPQARSFWHVRSIRANKSGQSETAPNGAVSMPQLQSVKLSAVKRDVSEELVPACNCPDSLHNPSHPSLACWPAATACLYLVCPSARFRSQSCTVQCLGTELMVAPVLGPLVGGGGSGVGGGGGGNTAMLQCV